MLPLSRHNPDAHFGREKYQLLAIKWLQKTPISDEGLQGPLGDIYGLDNSAEALEGFLGMIKLGTAWESTDFFNTVGQLLGRERKGNLAATALLRVKELQDKGRGSLHPYRENIHFYIRTSLEPSRNAQVESWFQKARKAADERQKNRWNYLRKGLASGRHPDTDSDFWNEWTEPMFPSLPGMTLQDLIRPDTIVMTAVVSLVSFFTLLWLISFTQRRRKKRHS